MSRAPTRDQGEGQPKISHFHEEVPPTHFCKVMMAPRIGMLPILDSFRPYLGPICTEFDRADHHRVSVVNELE
jgi:hypothetical protein